MAESTISYTIDLRDGTIEPPPTPFISFEVEPNDSNGDTFLETVLKINLNDPNLDNPFDVAEFQVEYDGTPTGFSVNIGDSETNNGQAGDGATQSNDAEAQIRDNTLSVFSNDTIGPPEVNRLLVRLPGFASEDSTVNFEVSDQFLGWDNNSDTSGNLNSPFLYALNGQPDSEGPINYDIFAAFNRVIAGSASSPSAGRIGSGVDKVTITLRDTEFDTLTVDTLVDEDDGDLSPGDVSLREAIGFISPGGTIDFDPSLASADVGFGQGTIGLELGQLVIDKSLTIDGLGADELTVSGNNASRVFNVDDGDSGNQIEVVIEGLTITGGNAAGEDAENLGGGIFNRESLELSNSTISGNSSDNEGGGIFNSDTTTLTNSIVSDNFAANGGGGITNREGTLILTNSSVSDNYAGDDGGAGIGNFEGGSATITGSTISGNFSPVGAGGIANKIGNVTLTNSTVSGNSTDGEGGGISNGSLGTPVPPPPGPNTFLTLRNSTISGNYAGDEGGGIFNGSTGEVTLESTIAGDNTADRGGGIFNRGNLMVTNSTISDNTAQIDGGGIYNTDDGIIGLTGTIVQGNIAGDDGGGIYNTRDGITGITGTTVRDNIAGDNGGGIANFHNGIFTVNDSTIEANEATDNGGGIYNIGNGTVEVIRSLIIDNIANTTSGTGGGILNRGTARVIDNSIISGNSASNGGGIFNENFLELTSSFTIGNIPNDVISV